MPQCNIAVGSVGDGKSDELESEVTRPQTKPCTWPDGVCSCYEMEQTRPDHSGRVWMHCEKGLTFSKASMSRFIMFCLGNNVEIGDIYVFDRTFPRSQVIVSVRLLPDQFAAFEAETGGKLREPPRIKLS
jgi:hypothetical protein